MTYGLDHAVPRLSMKFGRDQPIMNSALHIRAQAEPMASGATE
jgi:hypothetical protein